MNSVEVPLSRLRMVRYDPIAAVELLVDRDILKRTYHMIELMREVDFYEEAVRAAAGLYGDEKESYWHRLAVNPKVWKFLARKRWEKSLRSHLASSLQTRFSPSSGRL